MPNSWAVGPGYWNCWPFGPESQTAGPLARVRIRVSAPGPSARIQCVSAPGSSGRVQCVSAQRAIRSNSLAHRARNRRPVDCLRANGPTVRHTARANRMAGPLGLDDREDAKFLGRWPGLLELLALWAETQYRRDECSPEFQLDTSRLLRANSGPLRPFCQSCNYSRRFRFGGTPLELAVAAKLARGLARADFLPISSFAS